MTVAANCYDCQQDAQASLSLCWKEVRFFQTVLLHQLAAEYHTITEYPKLELTHGDHWVQLLVPQ